MTQLNMRNRTLGIMDNLPFLRSLNNECIDLIAIDPPFAANETFTGRPRPPITDAEIEEEKALADQHGVEHDEGRDTTVQDIWTWDANVHPDWLNQIEDDYPPVFSVIRAVEASASWSGRIPKEEAKQLLVDKFGPYCWGCGWEAPKFPNGERDLGLLEVDHIWARNDRDTVTGGSDELYNLALLHATCNRRKGNRLTLEELRRQNADDQRIYGPLVHLGEATQFASEYILQRNPQPSLP